MLLHEEACQIPFLFHPLSINRLVFAILELAHIITINVIEGFARLVFNPGLAKSYITCKSLGECDLIENCPRTSRRLHHLVDKDVLGCQIRKTERLEDFDNQVRS